MAVQAERRRSTQERVIQLIPEIMPAEPNARAQQHNNESRAAERSQLQPLRDNTEFRGANRARARASCNRGSFPADCI